MARPKRPPSDTRKIFGERVRTERYARQLTLEDLAEKASMNWSYIAQIERGERNISIDNMTALADGLGVPLRDLL
ncbi:HTH cro/C1-type domain-containing protein [Deinococcus saxicola]|uniref:helix-turn-helix domain-containing protein n=1 Tax=Deinococcus saxicola TaxID=249406 RepID=UPI0039EE70D1